MGQKVNPIGMRVGINRSWESKWYASGKNGKFADYLHEDFKIRAYVLKTLGRSASVSSVVIERVGAKVIVNIHTARPGIVIGRKGEDIEKLKKAVSEFTKNEVHLNIIEIRKPEIDATLIAENVAQQLERRIAFRRAMKRAVQSAMRLGAQGIRINCSGRLGGAEIARMEWYREGRVPLHTLRAKIDYGTARANTTYGVIGVKVWIYNGEAQGEEPRQFAEKLDRKESA